MNNLPTPTISVVIPAFNEAKTISRTLQSLKGQTYPAFEIIVVDNNSTDGTSGIANSFGARVIKESTQGIAHARQTGCLAATGEIIAITDSDTVLPATWLSTFAKEFQTNQKLVAFGGLYVLTGLPSWKIFIFSVIAPIVWSIDRLLNGSWSLPGANMAVQKKAFNTIGGFNTKLKINEDADLSLRLRSVGEVCFDRNFLVETSGRRYEQGFLKGAWGYVRAHLYWYIFNKRI